MNYTGWAIFMDCDMLMLEDISELWDMKNNQYAIQVCKHDYIPKSDIKFLNQKQTKYEKKNWSSLMLMNCKKCKALTKEYVHEASGLELHQFKWLESEKLIGELPIEWNWLVDEYPTIDRVNNLHYTQGGPWWKEYENCSYSTQWFNHFNECSRINLS